MAAWRRHLTAALVKKTDDPLTLSIVAPGVWRRRERLTALLGPDTRLIFGLRKQTDAVLGWGLKGDGQRKAREADLPYIAVEDAFLSRLGPNEKQFGLLGIVADPIGIYYDAQRASLVEKLIAASAGSEVGYETEALLDEFKRAKLCKFNALNPALLRPSAPDEPHPDIIVVDQIADDLSIRGGLASSNTFTDMLDAAHDENPGAKIAVKLHPYDGVGGRTGHLRQAAERYRCSLLPHTRNWIECAEAARHVYVVSSNAGLEALIAGTPVTCMGVPFYGGWGLTDDRQTIKRRTARPTLAQLCQVVYGEYGLYWSPSQSETCEAFELARFISAQQRHARMFSDGLLVRGVPKLKRNHLRPFVPKGAPLAVQKALVRPQNALKTQAIWASRALDRLGETRATEPDTLYAEDGFIRSSGLGADLIRPFSLVFDDCGIYFDPTGPSELERRLETEDLSDVQLVRARRLLDQLNRTRLSKYNVGHSAPELKTAGRHKILVPGQVENDASVRLGGGAIQTNVDLLRTVRSEYPDAFIIYKPHPDVEQAGRPGFVPNAHEFADTVLTEVKAADAIDLADEVHTLTSLLGFEALLRRKHVTCYGLPFYAGWGLTTDRLSCDRRTRERTLEELVALALIAYPLYISPKTNEPCSVEDTVALLTDLPAQPSSIPGGRQAMRLWRKLRAAPSYFR
ncbi:MAG: capsular polysaccharide biosynthesis protein [Pseudomonadota bacterium]